MDLGEEEEKEKAKEKKNFMPGLRMLENTRLWLATQPVLGPIPGSVPEPRIRASTSTSEREIALFVTRSEGERGEGAG